MRNKWVWFLAGWLIMAGLGNCNQASGSISVKTALEMTPTPQAASSSPSPSDPGLQTLIRQATEDLARRLAIDIDQIALIEVKLVVWPDASLGCPQPGMAYKQVPEDGALIRLGVGNQLYNYHSGGMPPPFLCEQIVDKGQVGESGKQRLLTAIPPRLTQTAQEEKMKVATPIPPPTDPGLQDLVRQATEDLARRLTTGIDQIVLIEVKPVVWPDASLGCPQPGMAYIQVPEDGALIRFSVAGRVYEYHSGGNRAPFLCEQRFKATKESPALDRFLTPPRSVDQ